MVRAIQYSDCIHLKYGCSCTSCSSSITSKRSTMHLVQYITMFLPVAMSYSVNVMEIKPILLTAPVSQIQWNSRGDWRDKLSTIDTKPHSYHTQKMSFNDLLPISSNRQYSKEENVADSEASASNDFIQYKPYGEEIIPPSYFEYSIFHPKSNLVKPRALKITIDPSLDESLSKLQIKETFLDAFHKFSTPAPKKGTPTPRPTKRTRKPAHDKPQPKPAKLAPKEVATEQTNKPETVNLQPSTASPSTARPQNNHLNGQSQIGNRESQMVIKPTVIVNIRGTVSNTDSEIKLESRASSFIPTNGTSPQNVFNINQEVNIERTYSLLDDTEQFSPIKSTKSKPLKDDKKEFKEESSIAIESSLQDNSSKSGKSLNTVHSILPGNKRKRMYMFQLGPLGGFRNV